MLWADLIKLTRRRLGEFQSQVVATAATGSAFDDATILDELNEAYRDIVDELSVLGPSQFVAREQVTYAGGLESVDLATLPSVDLSTARLQAIYHVSVDGRKANIDETERLDYARRAIGGVLERESAAYGKSHYSCYIEAGRLYLAPKPSVDVTLEIAYIQPITEGTTANAASEGPSLLPDAHQRVLAYQAAVELQEEPNPRLERSLERHRQRARAWAGQKRTAGPRYIQEVP